MNINDVTIIIPSYNNLNHLKNAYASLRYYYPTVELILIDDASTDDTKSWLTTLNDDDHLLWWRSNKRVGHTIHYDRGIEAAETPIVGILHADMYIGKNYIENLLKHLKRGIVVCATRVEPPLHPEGKEKIIKDFGQDFDTLNIQGFYDFVDEEQEKSKNKTTRGMFAPWMLYKEDFESIGGHDYGFAPFPYEDSDIFQRWFLKGFKLVQSRDSLVYHLTCRGHRWTEEIGKDSDDFKVFEQRAREHYIKKWGSWIENDEYGHPVIIPVYRKSITFTQPNEQLENLLSIWFNSKTNPSIEVTVDPATFTQQDLHYVTILNKIVKNQGQIGEFKLGNLIVKVNDLTEIQHKLVYY